jgi:type I restriction enzyme M protein
MIGAITGDIVGSRFEFHNHRSKDFELFTPECFATDDSVMTLAIAKALLDCGGDYSNLGGVAARSMQEIGRHYPNCGYGGMFGRWIFSDNPQPYKSFGNGAAMRVSPVGFAAKTFEEVIDLSRKVTEVTHNHPEGIKGAEAVAICVFFARNGKGKDEIRDYVVRNYYPLDFTLNGIRDTYRFNETCQDTVPQALQAFFESFGFEDAIRNAVSIGGDSDTLAAITGGIAEAFYGVPDNFIEQSIRKLDKRLSAILNKFYEAFFNSDVSCGF